MGEGNRENRHEEVIHLSRTGRSEGRWDTAAKGPAGKGPLVRSFVAGGHSAGHLDFDAVRGRRTTRWSSQYPLSRDEEKQFLIEAREMVEAATGQRPVGYNCNWLRRGPNTLSLLQELGYLYHVDDVSREAGHRRRMMSVSAHDRISGTPQMVRVWEEFLRYAKSQLGVAFLRKDEIARYALHSPLTLRESETI